MTYNSRKSKGAIDYCSDLQRRSTKVKEADKVSETVRSDIIPNISSHLDIWSKDKEVQEAKSERKVSMT